MLFNLNDQICYIIFITIYYIWYWTMRVNNLIFVCIIDKMFMEMFFNFVKKLKVGGITRSVAIMTIEKTQKVYLFQNVGMWYILFF